MGGGDAPIHIREKSVGLADHLMSMGAPDSPNTYAKTEKSAFDQSHETLQKVPDHSLPSAWDT